MKRRDISPDNFYGDDNDSTNWKDQLKKRKIMEEETRFLKIFKFFFKQENALQFLKDSPFKSKLHAFSFENDSFLLSHFSLKTTQDRIFLVSSLETFWNEYKNLPKKYHYFYEIIPYFESCNLYLDCEYMIQQNENVNGEKLIQVLLDELKKELKDKFDVLLKDSNVYDMDSSTNIKFSRHLIIHLTNENGDKICFKDNRQIGLFMKQFTLKLNNSYPEFLLEKENLSEKTSFVDLSVYSKNRSFRLFLSSKKDKFSYLEISESNKSFYIGDEDFFLKSLCVSKEFNNLLTVDNEEFPTNQNFTKIENLNSLTDLNSFIEALISDGRDSSEGKISSILNLDNGKKIIYSIKNYRYCENIKRPHKSNNIYFVVDIDRNCLFQKCYDPDCKDYRSPETRIPNQIIESLKEKNKQNE
jgi:DNA-directed primase/polymerase protein